MVPWTAGWVYDFGGRVSELDLELGGDDAMVRTIWYCAGMVMTAWGGRHADDDMLMTTC